MKNHPVKKNRALGFSLKNFLKTFKKFFVLGSCFAFPVSGTVKTVKV